jgi:SM-20-related protein
MMSMLDQLTDQAWALLPEFLDKGETQRLIELWQTHHAQARPATISVQKSHVPEIRGDLILWLPQAFMPVEDPFLLQLQQLRRQLSEGLYLNLHDFEAHFAFYPPGAGYDAHFDQPRVRGELKGRRLLSMVVYLNPDWQPGDGGELILWADSGMSKVLQSIAPVAGQAVLFRSDQIFHQVRAAKAPRLSIAIWFRRSPTFP